MADDTQVELIIAATVDGAVTGLGNVSKGLASVSAATVAAAKTTEGLKIATAGTTREFIVLGHEMLQGNFSRIPGSLMVMAERMGSLEGIVEGVVAALTPMNIAIGAAVVGFGIWAERALKAAEAINDVKLSMIGHGNAAALSSEQIGKYITQLSKVATVSRSDATEALMALNGALNMTHDKFAAIVTMLPGLAVGMGITVPEAAKKISDAMQSPESSMLELQSNYRLLTNSQLAQFYQAQKNGDQQKEQDILLAALTSRYTGLDSKVIGVTKSLNDYWQVFKNIISLGTQPKINPSDMIDNQAAEAKAVMANLALQEQTDKHEDILAKEREEEQEVAKGLALQMQLRDEVDKQDKFQRRINDLTTARNAALALGNQEEAKSLSLSMASLEAEKQKQATADSKAAMDADVQLQKSALDEALAEAGDNIEKKKALVDAYYQWLAQKYPQDVAAQNAALKQIAQLQDQTIKKTTKDWESFFGSFNSGIMGMLKGTETFKQSMFKVIDSLIEKGLVWIEGLVAKKITGETTMTAAEAVAVQQRSMIDAAYYAKNGVFMTQDQMHQAMNQMNQTSAVIAGNAARTTSNTGAAASSVAAASAGGFAVIQADAAKAFSGTYAYLAPEMGPFAAIPAGVAYAAVMAKESLLGSYETGTPYVPQTGPYMLHQGESVLTKQQTEAGGGAGDVHFHVSAMDSQSVAQFFNTHGDKIAAQVVDRYRRGDSSLTRYPR